MKKKFKPKIKTISIISFVVLICLTVPLLTHAGLADSIAKAIFRFIGNIILGICSLLLKVSASFFESMINAGFESYSNVIKSAWETIRDFANIFFVFGMIAIAFATILRIEKYGIKQILPKLIIVALLINFSMVFCYVFIDISNLVAKSFINMAENEFKSTGITTFSGAIANGLNVAKLLTPVKCMSDNELSQALEDCGSSEPCKTRTQTEYDNCFKDKDAAEKAAAQAAANQNAFSVFTTIVISAILLIIASVILFAGAIVLIARVVAMWVLVALAPLAAVCSFLPSLRSSWEKWSKNFLNWCIFAPTYSLFIWLAIKVSLSIKENSLKQLATAAEIKTDFDIGNAFFSQSSYIVKYSMVIGILLMGIIVAKQIGVAGGGMAFNMLKKQGDKMKGWAKKKSTQKAQFAGGNVFRGIGSIPGIRSTSWGRRIKYAGAGLQEKSIDEKTKKRYASYSPDDISKEINHKNFAKLPSSNRLALAQVASSENYRQKIDTNAAQRVRDVLKLSSFGNKAKTVKDFEEVRLNSIKDLAYREKRTKDVVNEGKLPGVSTKVLADPDMIPMIKRVGGTEEQIDAWLSTGQNMTKAINTLKETIANLTSVGAPVPDDLQFTLTALNGEIHKLTGPNLVNFTKMLGPTGFKRFTDKTFASLVPAEQNRIVKEIASNADPSQFKDLIVAMGSKALKRLVAHEASIAPPGTNPNTSIVENDPYLKGLAA